VASEGTERRLAAVLIADVVGYARLMAEDEDATVRTVTAYREEIELHVRQHRGRLVDFTGDAFLAEFPSAMYAVQCGVEIQRLLGVMNAALPAERQMQFRMGVHLGDIRVEGERIFGNEINIAARLEGLADAGGLFISSKVYEEVQGKPDLDYEDLGKHKVKNLPDPVRVYRVKMEAAPPKATPGSMRQVVLAVSAVVLLGAVAVAGWRIFAGNPVRPTDAPIRSIAVLPLENLSGDPEQEYFADGMTEALIGDLGKIGSLRVISRTSVMQYKDAPKPVREIAKELDVDGIIEGTVMREGDRVRITAQLIDARRDTHVWSDRYDRDLRDILALHSEVARAIAEQVRIELTREEELALAERRPVDPRAYDAYLRGLQLRGPEVLLPAVWAPKAIEQFEQAVEIDPEFAEGWAWLARARFLLGAVGFDLRFRSELPRAREAAERALELNDRLAEAYDALAAVHLWYEWDFAAASRAFKRAVEVSPSDPFALDGYAWYLLVVGRTEPAVEVSERVLRVAPLDAHIRGLGPRYFFYARQYERSLIEVERLRELAPDFQDIHIFASHFMLGQLEEAHGAMIALLEQCGAPCDWEREARERGWAEGGSEGEARAWLQAATAREGYSPFVIAISYSLLGETEEAFAWLDRGYRQRDPMMVMTKVHPMLDPLRSDPRFDDLLRRIGFPED
jgi:TolB-like protein/class 3 adenylate cyclase